MGFACAFGTSTAGAQDSVFIDAQPTANNDSATADAATANEAPAEPPRGARHTTLYLAVPFFLTSGGAASDVVRWDPGAGIGAGLRAGWEFGSIVPEVHVGYFINGSGTEDIRHLAQLYVSLGARYQFLNASRVIPFAAFSVRGTMWRAVSTGSLDLDSGYRPSIGLTLGGGAVFEVNRSLAVELAVNVVTDFDTFDDVFGSPQVFVVPRLGLTAFF
ncbi:MAG: hypothetical protein AAF938_04325 [Myxococcota bacterium]